MGQKLAKTDVVDISSPMDVGVEKVEVADPQTAAVDAITDMEKNSIIWDSCRLIYDTADFVKSQPRPDQVAVYGIKGNVRTPDQLEKAFSVRHCFDFHGSERYSLNLHLSGTRKPIRIQHCEPGPDGGHTSKELSWG